MLDILLPLNRASTYLEDSLNSIREAQQQLLEKLKYDSELILILNGINDHDINKIKSIVERIKLINYRIISSDEYGISNALNKGINDSNSRFIARADDDDLVMKDRFVRQIETMISDRSLLLVGTDAILIDARGENLGKLRHPKSYSDIREFLLFQNCFVHSSVIFRRDILEEVGLYRPDLDGIEDYDLWCRMSSRGKVINLPEYLVKHRIHDKQTTHALNPESNLQLREFFLSNFDVTTKGIELSYKRKLRLSHSLLALALSRKCLSMKTKKRVLALPYLFKSWILSPVFSTKIFLRILRFKCFSSKHNREPISM
jgi:glycosyltransferase involved in cell wall biosynthesis